ncbi:hypothetical protein NDI56_15975 [Haloarcula sp. S1CR25-12]|uniref:Transcriptional regulator n=1 Tax=Haloarcula saliterrae TaxID=2950534 RepID=A0ABU2FF67_9EURY|nr:hypothetical protein [Haloarcula sp. S1CR25-12]
MLSSLSDGPKRLHDIVEDVDGPRTTVRDNLKQLTERGLLEEDPGRRYQPTTRGQLVFELYRTCEQETAVLERLDPFLTHVPTDALPDSIVLFRDVNLVARSLSDPYNPLSTLADLLCDTAQIRALMPIVPAPVSAAIFSSPEATPLSVRLLTEGPTDFLLAEQSDSDPEPAITIRQTETPLPFGLAVSEERVSVCCFDDEMVARALIHTDDAAVRRWATQTFHRYWGGDEPHPPYPDRMSY